MSLKVVWRDGTAYISGTLDGKRVRQSLGTRDQKEAEELKSYHEGRIRRAAIYGADAESTFADAYYRYSESGVDDRGYFEPILKKIGKWRLKDVTPNRVKDLAKKLYPKLKPQTLNRYVIIPVSAVVNHSHGAGYCNPIRIERFKPVDEMQRVPVNREWIDRFRKGALDAYPSCAFDDLGERLGAYALFMFTTAARPTEAVLLSPSNFKFDERTGVSAKPTKNGEYRTFYLTEEMAAILSVLPPKKIGWGQYAGQWRVFGWADKMGPLGPWKAACKAAGLAYHSPYEAGRHSFATEAVTRQERSIVSSAALGNWKDPSVMMKRYAHPEKLGEFAEDVFGEAKKRKTK